MITSGISQFFVILLFLMLGVLLYTFTAQNGITNPAKSDELFPMVATGGYFPVIVGVLFIVGLISSAYSAAGSALTALTTSFTVDILGTKGKSEQEVVTIRKRVHIGMAIVMGIVIFIFNILNNTSVIDAVYILASYTYGPILGLFAFGMLTKKQVRDKYIPLVAILSPILCFILQKNSEVWFNGYAFSYELLIFNAFFTFIGLCLLTVNEKK
jgi:Na+/proline symporter